MMRSTAAGVLPEAIQVFVTFEALAALTEMSILSESAARECFDFNRAKIEAAASNKFDQNRAPSRYEGWPTVLLMSGDPV